MFRKLIKCSIFCVLCLSLFMNCTFVNAKEMVISVENVFPEEEVKALQEKNANHPIYQDKNENGEIQSNLLRSIGTYPTRKGVILVTDDKYKGVIPTGHAAIIYTSTSVVESLENGVVIGKNNWNESKTTCYGVSVMRTTANQDAKAADWCYSKLGKPYNWNYYDTSTRNEFYCSQLVWAAYYDNYGIDISTDSFGDAIHPSELVASSNTNLVYQK